jgi:hypothetical protein
VEQVRLGILDLSLPAPPQACAEWIDAYRRWATYGTWERDEDTPDYDGEDELEPPVPAGLGVLTAPQRALLADFLRLDADLLTIAAQASPPQAAGRGVSAGIGRSSGAVQPGRAPRADGPGSASGCGHAANPTCQPTPNAVPSARKASGASSTPGQMATAANRDTPIGTRPTAGGSIGSSTPGGSTMSSGQDHERYHPGDEDGPPAGPFQSHDAEPIAKETGAHILGSVIRDGKDRLTIGYLKHPSQDASLNMVAIRMYGEDGEPTDAIDLGVGEVLRLIDWLHAAGKLCWAPSPQDAPPDPATDQDEP